MITICLLALKLQIRQHYIHKPGRHFSSVCRSNLLFFLKITLTDQMISLYILTVDYNDKANPADCVTSHCGRLICTMW